MGGVRDNVNIKTVDSRRPELRLSVVVTKLGSTSSWMTL
jgi:hypothetical protein